MAYLTPIIANRKNCRNSGSGSVIVGLFIFLILGLMFFLLFNRSWVFGFKFSIIFWIGGFMIFLAIILAVCASILATNKPNNKDKNRVIYKQQNFVQNQKIQINPYKIQKLVEKVGQKNEKEIAVCEIVKFCRYCGAKKDLNAVFCHMCGSKF